nr:MAG: hydrolytic ATP binding site of dynein motor region [Bacteriophage sp.]
MVEIEHIQDIEKDQPAKSSAKEQKLKDPKDVTTETQDTDASEATEHDEQIENQEDNIREDSALVNHNTDVHDLKPGNRFYGSIKYNNSKGKQQAQQGIFLVLTSEVKGKRGQSREYTITNCTGQEYKVCSGAIKIANITDLKKKKKIEKEEKEKKELKKIQFSFSSLEPEDKLKSLIKAGMNNIWMVGPAGCGKSTIARNTAKELDIPYLCISCGIGTSATEFTGYKYPTREATKFAEFYAKKSIILIDEMTALDPSVAQVINAALANGEIETTTGTVLRHPECIIIATSNTFGNGADRQYVANNQLDASTIDRFTGAIIEVNYSVKYESQFDHEVVDYIYLLRDCIKINSLRRIASTRMIQAAEKMKKVGMSDWKDMLIINWSDTEKNIVKQYIQKVEKNKTRQSVDSTIEFIRNRFSNSTSTMELKTAA